MLKYATIIAPLLLKQITPNPVKTMTGYIGAIILAGIASIFFLAALFTWIASNYGLDVAFLVIALILTAGSIGLIIMSRVRQTAAMKKSADHQAKIKAMLTANEDPLAEQIPDEWLAHPVSQKILSQIEEKPFIAAILSIILGMIVSTQIFDSKD